MPTSKLQCEVSSYLKGRRQSTTHEPLAGDATTDLNAYYMHGAYETGLRAAAQARPFAATSHCQSLVVVEEGSSKHLWSAQLEMCMLLCARDVQFQAGSSHGGLHGRRFPTKPARAKAAPTK